MEGDGKAALVSVREGRERENGWSEKQRDRETKKYREKIEKEKKR